MKNPTEYVKMRVLAAIDMAEGKTITERIRSVSELTFEDEEGQSHRFTFRTIETWRLRYKKHGFTAICPKERSDKGKTRKVSPEQLLEAIEQVKPFFRGGHFNLAELYRRCIEKGLLRRGQVAPNTFRRLVNQLELLKPDKDATNKLRLTIDDAHLMPPQHLRKLRLLLEDTPGNYAIILFAQTELLAKLALAVNEDLQSRISFSALLQALTSEDIEAFILREFDRSGLAHSRLDTAALHLIAASCGGILRHAVHLTTASLVQAARGQTTTVTTAHVNTALMQPHWREHDHWIAAPEDDA
jgi:transposase